MHPGKLCSDAGLKVSISQDGSQLAFMDGLCECRCLRDTQTKQKKTDQYSRTFSQQHLSGEEEIRGMKVEHSSSLTYSLLAHQASDGLAVSREVKGW